MTNQSFKLSNDEKKLVLARLSTIPSNMAIAVGNFGTFSIKEISDQIINDEEAGLQYAEMQLDFLRSLKDGIFVNE